MELSIIALATRNDTLFKHTRIHMRRESDNFILIHVESVMPCMDVQFIPSNKAQEKCTLSIASFSGGISADDTYQAYRHTVTAEAHVDSM